MKSKILLFAIIGFTVFSFYGCWLYDSDNSSVSGSNGSGSNDYESSEGLSDRKKEYESYREACRDGDFDAAHKFLDRMKEDVEDWDSEQKYREAEDYVFNYEVNALVSQNSEEANTRIIYLLNEIPIEGTKQPIGDTEYGGSVYGNSCNRFNIKLNQIMELAISLGNQDIAKKILPLYKEDEIMDSKRTYKIAAYTYNTRDAAQAKYDEAVASGAFD